ncbi:MAG: T9SS type A sorting domain-containing protein [Bacteroidales bacterium]|nr:T9SS type A sorting domain-containing protein [Bacteroidales bacterium]
MRKLFLTFVTALLCNVVSFAQDTISINSAEDFLKIGKDGGYDAGGSFKQTADIDLGNKGPSAIISSFSGTYDGNGYNITYEAEFTSPRDIDYATYALFGAVTGTIKNLNLDANVTMSASGSDMRCGLLCGYLQNQGTIEYCNVTGNINSTAKAGFSGSSGTGMIAGRCDGTIQYCTASGNVSAPGYAGGITGQMGGIRARFGYPPIEYYENGTIKGCSFVGSVTSTSGGWLERLIGCGAFAGGMCGFATSSSTIDLCYVNADISSTIATGAGGTNNRINLGLAGSFPAGAPTVTNNYCQGTVNGYAIDSSTEITNSTGGTNKVYNNYYEGQQITGLQNADDGSGVEFAVINGEVVFAIGGFNKVCETPTNLTITKNDDGTHTADWDVAGTDNTVQESKWRWTLSGGNLATASQGEVNATTLSSSLEASPNPYTFTVYTDCSTAQNGLLSGSASIEFFVDCPTPTDLTASNITDNGFDISWDADVDCQLTVNGINYEISAGNSMEKQITGLDPETQYTVTVKAKCGDEYVEQATTNVTTARLAAPTGLVVNTVWNGSVGSGTATITWDEVDGLKYEIEGQTGDKESGFAISNLAENNYTLRLRAKKGTKTSDWVSMPYTISSPDAPKKPQVTYTRDGNEYDVTVRWSAGSTDNDGWIVNGGEVQQDTLYVLDAQTPGDTTTLSIVEKVGLSTSGALQVPIQVPCLPATLPNTVSTTQTSATFTFSQAIANRKIIIGSNEYPASATSITIDGLTSGTTYSYEVREYCNETQYSSVIANFATVACLQVSNLATSNIGTNSAKVSWSSQSSLNGLQYQVVLKKGETIVSTQTQPEKMITFNSLDKAAEYTVEVSETCGSDWGTPKTVTFTTLGDYSTVKTGAFNVATTWEGGNIPDGNDGNIIINQGHTLTLNVDLVLTGECRILNQGVLEIPAGKQLINTTDENVGGIIEVSTPQKTIDQWTFIGAPFKSGYKLGSIKPVSGSDVAMVEYDYNIPGWSDYFVNYQTTMEAAEGAFAWPFYTGVITFSTYDLGQNGTSYPDNAVADYELNNDDVQVEKYIKHTTNNPATDVNEEGNWMALANPYPAKLSVSKFLGDNNTLQGNCVYVFRNGTFDMDAGTNGTQGLSSGNIDMTEGFFVNFGSAGSHTANFNKEQLTNYPSSSSKYTNASSEFIELTLQNGKDKVRVYFAHNEDAEQGYDILDANKMFATTGVAEPYFVTDGIALIKEEVADLPYYATMNVRSQQDTVMNFVLTNLPEGYAVSIIDGEEVIDLVEGGVYSTEIASGENADRFKVLVKKNVGLADVEELDVRITNSNRHITITAQENVRTEVYNTLGQKVFETEETNFVLSGVASGAYVVKVQGAKASKSQKIVVE